MHQIGSENRAEIVKLKLTDPVYCRDPAGSFSKLLDYGTVFRGKFPIIGKVLYVTKWDAVSQVLRNTDEFVREPKNAGKKNHTWLQWIMPRMFDRLANNMIARDAEDHRRLRTLADQAFQRQSIEKMSPRLEEFANRELDKVELAWKSGQSAVDFVADVCRPMPLAAICELLGLPEKDRANFRKWFSGMSKVSSIFDVFKMIPMLKKTMKYLEEQIEQVRKHPRSGLISDLVQAEADGDRLSKDELLSTVMLLLLAGHETTVHLISNSLLTLMQKPECKDRVLADWSLCDGMIDEILRWCSIVYTTKPRFVARNHEFFGTNLVRGETVLPLLGCANFDPEKFDEPKEFRMDRSPNRHMTFGNGPHVCIGMKLAKAETNIMLQQIFQRWPNLKADFNLDSPDFGKRLGMRTLKTLKLSNR